MHGNDVHVVVVGQGRFLLHPFPDVFVVDDMVAQDKPRSVRALLMKREAVCAQIDNK